MKTQFALFAFLCSTFAPADQGLPKLLPSTDGFDLICFMQSETSSHHKTRTDSHLLISVSGQKPRLAVWNQRHDLKTGKKNQDMILEVPVRVRLARCPDCIHFDVISDNPPKGTMSFDLKAEMVQAGDGETWIPGNHRAAGRYYSDKSGYVSFEVPCTPLEVE
jgi:hypothetical protein